MAWRCRFLAARWSQHGRGIAAKRLISAPRSTRIRDAAEQAPFFKGWLNIPHFIELVVDPGRLEGFLIPYCLSFFGLDRVEDVLPRLHLLRSKLVAEPHHPRWKLLQALH